jgi:hypothetical protein
MTGINHDCLAPDARDVGWSSIQLKNKSVAGIVAVVPPDITGELELKFIEARLRL